MTSFVARYIFSDFVHGAQGDTFEKVQQHMVAASFQERARLIIEFEGSFQFRLTPARDGSAQSVHAPVYSLTWWDAVFVILGIKFDYVHPLPCYLHVLVPETSSSIGKGDWQGRMSLT